MGFPKFRGTFWGVPIIRIIVLWGLYWGPLIFGNYLIDFWSPRVGGSMRLAGYLHRVRLVGKHTLDHSESVPLTITVTEMSFRSTVSPFLNKP